MSILDLDATTLADQIRQGAISSLEVTEAYIEHLNRINPSVNCLVEDRFELARAEARYCDEQLAAEQSSSNPIKGRLFGVPISMKEAFDVEGMKTTGGLTHRKDMVIDHDAAVVSLLKNEGAIILGKTNTPTLCFCQETDNKLFGRTNNPWDLNRTVGGSSGGEAALIAAGGATVGIGADIGGSIRFPAHFNGVIGFKSGAYQVKDDGAYPPFTHPLQQRMFGVGAMAKTVQDARLINEIVGLAQPIRRNLYDFDIVMPIDQLKYPASSQTKLLLEDLRLELSENNQVVDEQPPMYGQSALLWQLIMSIDGAPNVIEAATGSRPIKPLTHFLQEKISGNSEWHQYLTWALVGARTFKPSAKQLIKLNEQIQSGDRKIREYLQNRLIILPVYHTPAKLHGEVYKELFSIRKMYLQYMPFIAYANTWGLPSLVIPIGEEEGLPVAIQIMSAVGNEDAIFSLGTRIEAKFRGWKRANPI